VEGPLNICVLHSARLGEDVSYLAIGDRRYARSDETM
jgi:hypothetical protein